MTKQQRQTILASRPAAMVLALSLVAGLSVPFVMLPPVRAAAIVPAGTTELSPAPVDQTMAVPPNVAITFDDSGSMRWDFLSDNPPFLTITSSGTNSPVNATWASTNVDTGASGTRGPWYCAGVINPTATSGIGMHVMNGVYYNPNITYVPPVHADGKSFPQAGTNGGTQAFSLANVENDGDSQWRDLSPQSYGTTDFTKQTSTNRYGQTTTKYWQCQYDGNYTAYLDSGNGNHYSTTVRVSGVGPYYYQYTGPAIAVNTYGLPTTAGLTNLYTASNWTAVAVGSSGISTDTPQNWANWWAYYRTHNQAARTALSRVFGSPSLAQTNAAGGYGSNIRVAWQNLYAGIYGINDQFVLQPSTIISALIDQNPANCNGGGNVPVLGSQSLISATTYAPPSCYRSDFFNWIFQVGAQSGTPTRSSLIRAGQFFERGGSLDPNNVAQGDLHDPYWQPPQNGSYDATSNPGNELYCRQNFQLLLTDGLWNYDQGLPDRSTLALASASGATTLPDGVSMPATGSGSVTSIFQAVANANSDGTGTVSLSDIAYDFWATDLRPDLYLVNPDGTTNKTRFVPPYLPDSYAGLFGAGKVTVPYQVSTNPDGTPNYQMPAEEYFNPKNDPASWPHMSDYMVGMGVSGALNYSDNTDCKSALAVNLDACDLRKGVSNSTGAVGWPQPDSGGANGNGLPANIDDTWHAALAGRGQFFSAGNPQQLVDQLTSVLSSISARTATPQPAAVNASVATVGSLSFNVGHGADWSGVFQAILLNPDGSVGAKAWDASTTLAATSPASRNIYTDAYKSGTLSSFAFSFTGAATTVSSLDAVETAGLGPASSSGNDTAVNRVKYLLGDATHETDGTYRSRTNPTTGIRNVLGAIIHSQPVYVSYPNGGYFNTWPAGAPEANTSATGYQGYDAFVSAYATRPGTVYVGANDGMLHAFNAPAPTCTAYTAGACTAYNYGSNPGQEDWAFIPRAVYANLGNLTSASNFQFRPTVDGSPVTRDVFFGESGAANTDNHWHTILAGGVGVGGRGVYALDITGTANSSTPATGPNSVLWEFDSDMAALATGCTSIVGTSGQSGTCSTTDLGYTVSQPNIGRLANGKWVVIVPNGYFPDCSQADIPTPDKISCAAIAAQAPKDASGNPYSALFVLDAETGQMIAELKTPTNLTLADGKGKVTSFGLATPVMGDYSNDQIDDVAFAGDLQGNLWRFDLSKADPTQWTVTLVYQGNDDANGNQGLQPITTMPRLFPDPATNRFMVVFGTGKYLGAADNGTTATQAMIGVRDVAPPTGTPQTVFFTQATLTPDYLHESTAPATLPDGKTPNPNAGATLRCVTGSASDSCASATASQVKTIPAPGQAGGGGWFINLYTTTSGGTQNDLGERVVVSPGAIFASNTVVFETLLTGSSGSDPCNPSTQGAVMALNAVTAAPAGVSSLGGWPMIGARINNARTSGSLPIVSALGGGQAYLPGLTIAPGKNPISIDAPIWRRREWSKIQVNQ